MSNTIKKGEVYLCIKNHVGFTADKSYYSSEDGSLVGDNGHPWTIRDGANISKYFVKIKDSDDTNTIVKGGIYKCIKSHYGFTQGKEYYSPEDRALIADNNSKWYFSFAIAEHFVKVSEGTHNYKLHEIPSQNSFTLREPIQQVWHFRQEIAIKAMIAMLSNPHPLSMQDIARESVNIADEMIEQLNKKQ